MRMSAEGPHARRPRVAGSRGAHVAQARPRAVATSTRSPTPRTLDFAFTDTGDACCET